MKNQLLIYHILPLAGAAALFFAICSFSGNSIVWYDHKSAVNSFAGKNYFLDYSDNPGLEDRVRNTLNKGSAIVVMGSSELYWEGMPAMPYNFFTKQQGIPCLGLGRAGNQTFCIYSQLCAMGNSLKNARLVIMISPSWFTENGRYGTPLSTFLDFNDERFLYNIYYSPDLPEEFKNYVEKFVAHNINDVESGSAIIKLFYYTHLCKSSAIKRVIYGPYKKAYELYCSAKIKYTNTLIEKDEYAAPLIYTSDSTARKTVLSFSDKVNWDSLYDVALKDFAKKSAHNNLGMYDSLIPVQDLTIHDPTVPANENRELRDLGMLLKLLKHYHTDAMFVVLPYNPFAYPYITEMVPTIKYITDSISKYQFYCYNMYVPDKQHYAKGTQIDITHLGNLGWYRADSAILEHFKITAHE